MIEEVIVFGEVARVIAHDTVSPNVSAQPTLMAGVTLSCSANLVHVRFSQPHRALSSAVLNGGFCYASDFLNLKVASHSPDVTEDPSVSLQRLSEQLQCRGPAVGMMTAASLDSLRVVREEIAAEMLAGLVTTGLENARSAGDLAEHRALDDVPGQAPPALRHRILLNFEGEAEGVHADQVIEATL